MEKRSDPTAKEAKKRFLMSYRLAVRREKQILEEIQILRMNKMFPSAANDGMPRGKKHSDLSDYIVLMDEQIEKLKKERLEEAKRYKEVREKIREVDGGEEREVLTEIYIKGKTWDAIAAGMGCSRTKVKRILDRALEKIECGIE